MFSADTLKVSTPDGRNFILLESFIYERKDGQIITVPAGITSDGASTPCALWPTIPPFGTYWKAAFLHDYLYRDTECSKDFCDGTLLEAMEELGVGDLESKTIYEGVHLFGWSSFEGDRKAELNIEIGGERP
jgi:hypothetical protein